MALGQQQVVAVDELQARPATQAREAIGQHRPAAAPLPADQSLGVGDEFHRGAAPGPGHHHAGLVGIEGIEGIGRSSSGFGSRQGRGSPRSFGSRADGSGHRQGNTRHQCRSIDMQQLLDRQVAMHRPVRRPQAGIPGFAGHLPQGSRFHGRQPSRIPLAEQPTAGGQEGFLVHGLVGAAVLEPRWPIGREQQQRHGAAVGLHHSRQQVGHSRAGGGNQGSGPTVTAPQPHRQEGR